MQHCLHHDMTPSDPGNISCSEVSISDSFVFVLRGTSISSLLLLTHPCLYT